MKIIRKKKDCRPHELFTTQPSYDYDYLMTVLKNMNPDEIFFEYEGCNVPCTSTDDYSLACRLFQISLQINTHSRFSVSLHQIS